MIVNNGKVIDLDSDVETIEARVQKEQEAKKSEEPKPGDYVIKTKEPGKDVYKRQGYHYPML